MLFALTGVIFSLLIEIKYVTFFTFVHIGELAAIISDVGKHKAHHEKSQLRLIAGYFDLVFSLLT